MREGFSLTTNNLIKKYDDFVAVDDVNISINPGDSYGFLGPNGAGKTTTLMMILGVLKPTSGNVEINNLPIKRSAFELKRKIGVVAEYQTFYEDMSAWEYLTFFGQLYGVEFFRQRAEALLKKVDLWEWRNVLIGGYSTGMKKKLGFVRALLNKPELLVLDEPVAGLDPYGITQIRDLIMSEQEAGCSLLISSHILSEVENTVNHVGIIANGKLLVEDKMENLRSNSGVSKVIQLRLAELNDDFISQIKKKPYIKSIEKNENTLNISITSEDDVREDIGKAIMDFGMIVLEMKQKETSLEDAYIAITNKNLNELKSQLEAE